MLAYVFILALSASSAFVSATEGIRPCTGGRPLPQRIVIDGCNQTPCDVFQGSDALMYTDMRTERPANELRPQVFATALGQTIEYFLPPNQQNACDHLTVGSCPLSANEDATYRFSFPITPVYPPIPVTVELSLFDHTNQVVFCALIDIHVRLR
ncbi:NPC intracellular cholesterol transporter 2 [Pseudolycoriella hygida]|uniref:NPC intracellular cholesterol transporter 2 n=1 Tax=Pseudolycoriella hygida TaxID=35572 RepID=A0A9Q0N828_9DIPT|nr:NPC intracellular cholesterol transporter 2 [Pseudolycoriella hygida]